MNDLRTLIRTLTLKKYYKNYWLIFCKRLIRKRVLSSFEKVKENKRNKSQELIVHIERGVCCHMQWIHLIKKMTQILMIKKLLLKNQTNSFNSLPILAETKRRYHFKKTKPLLRRLGFQCWSWPAKPILKSNMGRKKNNNYVSSLLATIP